jgi:hypothetical protein
VLSLSLCCFQPNSRRLQPCTPVTYACYSICYVGSSEGLHARVEIQALSCHVLPPGSMMPISISVFITVGRAGDILKLLSCTDGLYHPTHTFSHHWTREECMHTVHLHHLTLAFKMQQAVIQQHPRCWVHEEAHISRAISAQVCNSAMASCTAAQPSSIANVR